MGQIGRRIAHTLQHGKLTIFPERQQRLERRMEPDVVAQLHDLIAGNADLRPKRVVGRIGVWNHHVETVVAALELDQEQQLAIARAGGGRTPGNLGHELRR